MNIFLTLIAGIWLVEISYSEDKLPASFIRIDKDFSQSMGSSDELIFAHVVSYSECYEVYFHTDSIDSTALSSWSKKHCKNISIRSIQR